MENITKYMDSLNSFASDYQVIVALFSIAVGVVLCFFGYKLCEFFIGFFSFILIGSVGLYFGKGLVNENLLLEILIFIVVGTIGALLSIKLYKIGVFIFSFFVGIGVITTAMGTITGLSLIVGIVAGVVIGVFAVIMTKHVMIILTSIAGAFYISQYLGALIKLESMYIIAISVLVGVVGMVVQYLIDRMAPKKIGKRNKEQSEIKEPVSTSKIEEDIESMRLDGDDIVDSAESTVKSIKKTEQK